MSAVFSKLTNAKGGSRNGGQAQTCVVLIHGLGGTPTELRPLVHALTAAGYAVTTPCLAGHCGTAADLARSTARDWEESVDAAIEVAHARGAQRIVVGGLSMGAVLALAAAQRRPGDIDGLILLAPAFRLDGWAMPWTARLLPHARPWMPLGAAEVTERPPYGLKDERVRALVTSGMKSGDTAAAGHFTTPLRALAEFNVLSASVVSRLGEIAHPIFIAHPREDDMADLSSTLSLQRALAGRVETLVLEDSYHLVTLDRQRERVAVHALAFLDRLCADAADLKKATAAVLPAQPPLGHAAMSGA